jgi:hypothetical protein
MYEMIMTILYIILQIFHFITIVAGLVFLVLFVMASIENHKESNDKIEVLEKKVKELEGR